MEEEISMKCEIFTGGNPEEVQDKMNDWLSKHSEVKIQDITQTDSNIIYEWDGIVRNKDKHATREFVITILYEDTDQSLREDESAECNCCERPSRLINAWWCPKHGFCCEGRIVGV